MHTNRLPQYILLSFYLVLLLFPRKASATDAEYHRAEARLGDGVYSLLRRFELDSHSCNFQKFYELNELQREAALVKGKAYYLPIMLFRFNGKTIRSSIGNEDYDMALRIQRYNERMYRDGRRQADFRKDLRLWVPYHLINCGEADLDINPPTPIADEEFTDKSNPKARDFPIFGSRYSNTPLRSNALEGQIFYIVSGHGGPDPGAMGLRANRSLCEDEYAYDVALRLCRKLLEHGATAYMITRDENDGIRSSKYLDCDEDETVWGGASIPRSQKARLGQRSDIINALYEKNRSLGFAQQQTIIIHVDSRTRRERTDLFFYYQYGNTRSRELARDMLSVMQSKYKQHRPDGRYDGEISTRDLHMLREVKPSAVYVELGNIRNSIDQQRIVLESNRIALANWLFEGIMKGS